MGICHQLNYISIQFHCFTGIAADEGQTVFYQGMEPVDSHKRFYQTDRTDREVAVQDINENWTDRHPLLVSKVFYKLDEIDNIVN